MMRQIKKQTEPKLVSISIEENGPARVAFKVVQEDNKRSKFTNIIALSDGGECVEVYSEIEWQSLCTLAKNKFAFNCSNEKATYDLGLGAIERENMNEKLFEVPAQKWADLTDESGSFGVSVISECKYGWDKYDNNTLRLTVLHTPIRNYRIDSMQSMLDIGLNRYSFAIYSHSGKVGKATQLEARKFVQPMIAVSAEKHSGKLGSDYSFGKISADSIIVRAMKKAEDSDEIIIRLNEGANESAENVSVELGAGIASAREMFASEEFKCDAVVENGKLITSFKPYEIKTFAVTLVESDAKGKKAKSSPAKVKFDKNIITNQRNEKSDFEYNIPREITPDVVSANGIDFAISKTSENAFVMNGQQIEISENTDKLCLLCSSLSEDKEIAFDVDGEKISKKVLNMFEAFAAWDLVDLGDTAYVKDGKLGFEATHSHVNGNDAIAKGMYFYIVEIDVKGKKCVTLPFENDVVVISATEYIGNDVKLITPVFDEVDENRKQTFKMTPAEKIRYQKYKCVWELSDKDNFITHRNNGRK